MSTLYDPFFDAMESDASVGGAADNQTFVLRQNGTQEASKNVGFGATMQDAGAEVQFVGTNTVTFSSVSGDFNELMVKTEFGQGISSLVNTVLFTFSTKSPNGNNVDLDTAKVYFTSGNKGLYYMMKETWSDPDHRVQLVDNGGTPQDNSVESFSVDHTNSEVTSDNSPIRIDVGSSYTADKDRLQYNSSAAGYQDVSEGDLNSNSFSVSSGDAVEITGNPAITTSISL